MAVVAATHTSVGTGTAVQIAGVGGQSGAGTVYIQPVADILVGGTSVAADCDFPLEASAAEKLYHEITLGAYEELWAVAASGTTTIYTLTTGR
jgi:hypothetical protein